MPFRRGLTAALDPRCRLRAWTGSWSWSPFPWRCRPRQGLLRGPGRFHADHDHQVHDALRFVQLAPPGSACSVVLGTGVTKMAPGSQQGLQIVVDDVEEARRELVDRGVNASDMDVQPWGSFVNFSDPDGNTWLQQLPPREQK